ncbi:MAG TPA: hypothetical protein VF765_29315 [Polyangiaceae bacterium]
MDVLFGGMQRFGLRAGWLLAGALAALLPALAMWGFTVDDALIPVRYARHLVTGAGWRFDAGGPSTDGVTPLPWPLVLAPLAHAPALAVLWRARVLGLLAWTAAGAALGEAAGRRAEAPKWARVAALATLVLSVPVAAHAVSGMETAIATTLATFAVLCARRPLVAATLAGLAASLRPELAAWAIVLSAGVAVVARRGVRGAVTAAAIAAVPFAACALARVAVWGRPAPLALMAKPGELSQGLAYAGAALVVTVTPVLVVAPLALRRTPAALVVVLAALAQVVAIASVGGDWMPFARLMVPVAPSLAWAGVLLSASASRAATAARSVVAILLGIALLAIGRRTIADARGVASDRAALVEAAGPLLAGAGRVAALDVGWVGAATEADVIDLAGLTDVEIAALPGGHTSKRVDAMFLLARDPDVLVLYRPPRVVEARLEDDEVIARHFETSAWLPLGHSGAGYVVMIRRRSE